MGNGAQDHSEWGRVEEITVPRPSYKVTATSPGSDLAGETAAAMTAGHIVFKDTGRRLSPGGGWRLGLNHAWMCVCPKVKEMGSFFGASE